MKIVVYTAIAITIAFITPVGVCQQETPVGVRAIGMGETFVATADDATAITWNPAGISQLRHYALSTMYAKLFEVTDVNHLGLAIPISEGKVLGADWIHNSIGDSEVGFALDQFDLSYGHKIGQALAVGANLKYISTRLSLEGNSRGEKASGWGSDIGLIFKLPNLSRASVGFSAKNLLGLKGASGFASGTSLIFNNGRSDLLFPASYKIGLAYHPNHKWLLGADLGRFGHIGAEFTPHSNLTLRAGMQKDLKNLKSEALNYSMGGSLRYKWGEFNYAYLIPPSLPATSLFSVTFSLDLWSLPIKIESIKFREIYPVHQYFYAKVYRPAKATTLPPSELDQEAQEAQEAQEEPSKITLQTEDNIGRIWLKNLSDEPLDLKVKIHIDKYTNKGGTEAIQRVHIEPNQRISIPFERLVLNEESLQLLYPKAVEAKVEVIDLAAESRRKATASASVTIQARNNTKLDDIAKLASFITPKNRAVSEFAQGVINQHEELIKSHSSKLNQNLLKALLIFNELYGISYTKDPNLPFESGKIDEIKFPAEMLRDLTQYTQYNSNSNSNSNSTPTQSAALLTPLGDCDDTTALFCSLLESIGIRTALIKKAKHVLMAFDLGGISLEQLDLIEQPEQPEQPEQSEPSGPAKEAKQAETDHKLPEFYIGIGGYAWIPIETTLIKEGFLRAWLKGIEETKSEVKDSITTQDAWEIYGSVNLVEGGWKPEFSSNEATYRKTIDDLNNPFLKTIIEKYGGLIK